jgi:hypothetical protein
VHTRNEKIAKNALLKMLLGTFHDLFGFLTLYSLLELIAPLFAEGAAGWECLRDYRA